MTAPPVVRKAFVSRWSSDPHRQSAFRSADGLSRSHGTLGRHGAWVIRQRLEMLAKRPQNGRELAGLLVGHMRVGFQDDLGHLL